MLKERSVLKIVVIVFVLLATGILPIGAQGQPKRGGSLKVISTLGDVNCIGYGPEVRMYTHMLYAQPVVETLFRWDNKGQSVPQLAEGWKYSDDLKSLILYLRKGVKFHDGTDFDAEAVKFNIEVFQKSGRGDFAMVSSMDVLDKHTIRLNFKSFNNQLMTNLTQTPSSISSPTAVQKMGVDSICRNPVGTGPFKFKSWERDLSVKFERFNGYWQKGKPYLDTFEWIHIKDPMTAISAFMAGEADAILGVPPLQAAEWKKSGQYQVMATPVGGVAAMGDSANPNSPFAKLKVRQAVSHAIDSQAIANSIYHGLTTVTNQYSGPNTPQYNKAVVGYPYDPQKAKKLLAEAGYPNGFKTSLWWLNHAVHPQFAGAIQGYLKEVGIEAEVKFLEHSAWNDKVRSGWDGLIYIITGGAIPDNLRAALTASICKTSYYKSMACNEEVEDSLNKASLASDLKTKTEWMYKYNQLMTDKYCLMNFILTDPAICAIKKHVLDSELYEIAYFQLNLANAYVSK